MSVTPRKKTPEMTVQLLDDTQWKLSARSPDKFTMIVVYRGLHCPICSQYLKDLNNKLGKFKTKGVEVIAVSSDTRERAETAKREWGLSDLRLGYGLSIDEARNWGLYISGGIKDEPEQFVEPGLFLIQPDQILYAASIQTMPFARPSFSEVLGALDFVLGNDYPARGEA